MGEFKSELGDLVNPECFHDSLEVSGIPKDTLISQLKMMITIRVVEEVVANLVTDQIAKCPCHLGIGQEAVAVGVSKLLKNTDHVFGGHRSHAHYLAVGGDVYSLFAEILGRITGCSKGMGGSMHLFAGDKGFKGALPIVGGTTPIAMGAGLAAKMDGKGDVAVSYFGDGAIEGGVVQESLNLASVLSLPVLFVCENNLYSSHLDIQLRQSSDRVSRFADAHHIEARVVDGNDVLAVANATEELLARARAGKGPGFLEAITYRWRGHVGPDENIDVGVRRKNEDLVAWKKRDPIRRLVEGMEKEKFLEKGEFENIEKGVRAFVIKAKDEALEAPYPEQSALLDLVYSEKK
jgi:acetoin:2,6-dichlorophenolindophenol oxidoreductase subunit alpha